MSTTDDKKRRKRTLEDQIISGLNSLRYTLTEPLLLRVARVRHEREYADPKKSPRPHVVLLDLCLPKVDGLEILKEIKTSDELKKTPVVILTTSKAEQDVAEAYEYHANSYLVKPIDFDKFTWLMDNLGFYWLGWNHYPWSEPPL